MFWRRQSDFFMFKETKRGSREVALEQKNFSRRLVARKK